MADADGARGAIDTALLDLAANEGAWMLFSAIPGAVPEAAPTEAFVERAPAGLTLTWPRIDWETKSLEPVAMPRGEPRFVAHRHSVPEPADGEPLDPARLTGVLVPGIAFTESGARLGRGGGFYDRFLPRAPRALRIGVAFEAQIVESIPLESHDEPVHVIVTERRVIRPTP